MHALLHLKKLNSRRQKPYIPYSAYYTAFPIIKKLSLVKQII